RGEEGEGPGHSRVAPPRLGSAPHVGLSVALDLGGLAQPPTGPGPGSHQLRGSLHGPGHQRALSLLRRAGDVDGAAGQRARRLGAALGAHAQGTGRPSGAWLADPGPDRPWHVFAAVVPLPGRPGLAPLPGDSGPGILAGDGEPEVAGFEPVATARGPNACLGR